MTMHPFNLKVIDPSWKDCIDRGLQQLAPDYLQQLTQSQDWLPGPQKIFNAFSIPINQVNYVLFGESPYPRTESANGYAFWDQSVTELWSPSGLSKKVNRATSLRNIIKMLLIAEGLLDSKQCGQEAIANINKTHLVETNEDFFQNFLDRGFLLLNATPVLQDGPPKKDARAWHQFVAEVLQCLILERPHVKFLLLGNIANTIDKLLHDQAVEKLYAEHPYNLSFIHNKQILAFFKPLHLLRAN